jgi:hypothetical protein
VTPANLLDLLKLSRRPCGFVASWLYQGLRQSGQQLPFADDVNGRFNLSTQIDPIYVKGLLPI